MCIVSPFNGKDIYYLEIGNKGRNDLDSDMLLIDQQDFVFIDINSQSEINRFNNNMALKVTISDPFFISNPLNGLWDLYNRQLHNDKTLTDMNIRILNASLNIGESAKNIEIKNSFIYTCIALETLFTSRTNELFQPSIADKIAHSLAFLVGEDKHDRYIIINLTKEVYTARSKMFHGGQLPTIPNFYLLNKIIRHAIIKLLTNEKYQDIKTLTDLNDILKDAQLSY